MITFREEDLINPVREAHEKRFHFRSGEKKLAVMALALFLTLAAVLILPYDFPLCWLY